MGKTQILEKLQEIFCDVLDNEDIQISEKTAMSDIGEWDSLAHIQLVAALNKEFGIKFSAKEIMEWTNVEAIYNCLADKLNY